MSLSTRTRKQLLGSTRSGAEGLRCNNNNNILTQQKEMERIRGKFEDATPCTQSYRKATAALAVAEREEKETQEEVVKLYGEMQRVLSARQKRESDALLRKMEEEKRRENAKRMEEIMLQKQREEMASVERAKERSKAAAAAKP